MDKQDKQQLINEQQSIILDRESRLTSTDYIAAKIAEGKATREEYSEKIALRQQWRDDINAAQAEIERLEVLPADWEPERNAGGNGGGSSEGGDNEER